MTKGKTTWMAVFVLAALLMMIAGDIAAGTKRMDAAGPRAPSATSAPADTLYGGGPHPGSDGEGDPDDIDLAPHWVILVANWFLGR